MKKIFLFILIIFMYFLLLTGCEGQAPSEGEGPSEESTIISGPAPNSGDGIPDGPGWE